MDQPYFKLSKFEDQSVEIRRKEIIASLGRYFGNEALDYLDYTEKNWANETYVGGRNDEFIRNLAQYRI